MLRIVVTECDHDGFEPEQEVARRSGVELVVAQSTSREELVESCREADGVLVQYARLDAGTMDALPRLRAIGRYGVGVDSVDVAAATERGIAVCNVPDYGTEAVSDHAIALALTVARGIPRLDRQVRRGVVDLAGVRPLRQLDGRVFGVVGTGLIGAATARKARGLGYRVLGFDLQGEPGTRRNGVELVGLDELLSTAAVVSLHVPLTAQSQHLVGERELRLMRPDAVLVNTSRGGVVDTEALVRALRGGRIAGAGLDVLETEPVPADHPLLECENVALTPHFAWYTEESYAELKRRTMTNVVDVCQGRRPRDVLNPSVLPAGAGTEEVRR